MVYSNPIIARCLLLLAISLAPAVASAEQTGFSTKRPIIAGACRQCVWGPLAEIVRDAMKPAGYDIQVCYNCNQADSPRYVAYAWKPKPLTAHNLELGDPPPPDGPVDFGVTESNFLRWMHEGKHLYAADGPQPQLRLIAKIEDPVFILVAVKADSGITDLSQLTGRKGLRVLTENDPWVAPILERYRITKKQVESNGGKFTEAMALKKDPDFDVLISSISSMGSNLESNVWHQMSEKFELRYLDVPRDVLERIVSTLGGELTEVPFGYFPGVDRRILTAGRSGHAIYGRADMPDDFAYAAAKAMDEKQAMLKWAIRPFSYNVHTVWKNGSVKLHPGAERYYRERGYMK